MTIRLTEFRLPDEPIVPTATQQSNNMTVDQAMMKATQLQAQGNLQAAEQLLRQILQQQPQHAHALNLLGVIAFQANRLDLAMELVEKALAIDESVALFHANYGEMCRLAKRLDDAIKHGRRAVELEPGMPSAHSNLGIAYFDTEDYENAEACQLKALELQPGLVTALNNLGSIYREREDRERAIDYYRQALAVEPENIEPLNNLGTVLTQEDRAEEAIEYLQKALTIRPQYTEALCNLGLAYNALEQYANGVPLFQQALEHRPEYLEALLGIARAKQEMEGFAEAVACAKKAVALSPEKPETHNILGGVYSRMGHNEEAMQSFDKALQLDPELTGAMLGKGNLYMENGDMEQAESLFRQALDNDADEVAVRFHLSQVGKVKEGDENLKALITQAHQRESLSVRKATYLHFALGKSFDDTGEYDRAFEHFQQGCKLKRDSIDYDAANNERIVDSLIELFDQQKIEGLSGSGIDSDLPVFVLGMPRSGTTLTEQIIASHPDVYGAGELFDLLSIAQSNIKQAGQQHFPDNLQGLTAEVIRSWGVEYIAGLKARDPAAKRITDKMPANYLLIGLIHLMLPNAKIVHVMRNPLDTCLSCFTRLFQKGQDQSYDLVELGRYYVAYHRLMNHWRNVLPEGTLLDVRYEDLVKDNEAQARRLIEYCDLEWNDACLEFHKTKRSIKTASVVQVRKPVYTSSVERWRRYEKFLGPLIEALGDLAQ